MARTQSNQPVRRSSRLNPTRHQTRPIFDGVLLNRLTNKSAYHGPASRLSAGNVGFESPPQRTIRLSEIVLSETPPPAPAQPESNHSEYDPDNVANQDNASESQPDVHFNLPFMQEWTLVDPSALAPDLYSAATNFSNPPMDVDRWEIALSPTAFSNRFPFVLTMVQLVSHIPQPQPSIAETSNISSWIQLGTCSGQLWVRAKIKDPFFKELQKYQTVQPGAAAKQASRGHAQIPIRLFVDCLIAAGCRTIWLKTYAQKMEITPVMLGRQDPASATHPLRHHNQFDIGKTFKDHGIWLWAPANAAEPETCTRRFPIIIPASKGYGTVEFIVTWKDNDYHIKIYPRLTHLIKSFNSKLAGVVPKSLKGIKGQVKMALGVIQALGSASPAQVYGFRIEIGVQAPSLKTAVDLVNTTPFFDPNFWLNPSASWPGNDHLRLVAKFTTQGTLLANANWMYKKAMATGNFNGRDVNAPSSDAVQVMIDLLAALGWNSGKRDPTNANSLDAWWVDEEAGADTSELAILAHINHKFPTIKAKLELLNLFRQHSQYGYLPCRNHPDDSTHRYQVHEKNNFRLRCGKSRCHNHMKAGEAMAWIADLAGSGKIPLLVLGYGIQEKRREGQVRGVVNNPATIVSTIKCLELTSDYT